MAVSDAAIETAVSRLAVHYKGSFASEKDVAATMFEYKRCLERMPWCDDETFLNAVDWVIDHERTNGFLPDWSVLRTQAWRLMRDARMHQQGALAIEDIRRRTGTAASEQKFFINGQEGFFTINTASTYTGSEHDEHERETPPGLDGGDPD